MDSLTYLLLAYSQADEADALYGLAAEQPELLLHGVLDDVFERGHEQVVVWHKLLLSRVSHRGDGRHHLLQDQFGALMDQLEGGKRTHLRLLTALWETFWTPCCKYSMLAVMADISVWLWLYWWLKTNCTSCSLATMMTWRCCTKLSRYGISSDLGQSSVKLMRAAAACACTRGLLWSFMVWSKAEITWKGGGCRVRVWYTRNLWLHLQNVILYHIFLFYRIRLKRCIHLEEICSTLILSQPSGSVKMLYMWRKLPYRGISSGRLGRSLSPFVQWRCRQRSGPLGAEEVKRSQT